jgi:hypothetical protein
MRKSPHPDGEPGGLRFATSRPVFERCGPNWKNSFEEVMGEIGLVLGIFLSVVVAINLVLISLHVS